MVPFQPNSLCRLLLCLCLYSPWTWPSWASFHYWSCWDRNQKVPTVLLVFNRNTNRATKRMVEGSSAQSQWYWYFVCFCMVWPRPSILHHHRNTSSLLAQLNENNFGNQKRPFSSKRKIIKRYVLRKRLYYLIVTVVACEFGQHSVDPSMHARACMRA